MKCLVASRSFVATLRPAECWTKLLQHAAAPAQQDQHVDVAITMRIVNQVSATHAATCHSALTLLLLRLATLHPPERL